MDAPTLAAIKPRLLHSLYSRWGVTGSTALASRISRYSVPARVYDLKRLGGRVTLSAAISVQINAKGALRVHVLRRIFLLRPSVFHAWSRIKRAESAIENGERASPYDPPDAGSTIQAFPLREYEISTASQ